MTETVWIGTSGYSYPEWKGSFYPQELSASKRLPYYSARFSTVEINNTFYRMPSDKVLDNWASATPEGFAFTLKAPRRITHDARLRDCADLVDTFCTRARTLGPKLGVLLFQLPPYFRVNLDTFDAFLESMPTGVRAAFEFRHKSWFSEELYSRLRSRNLALCISDNEKSTTPVVVTADYGYFRLRDEGYGEADITRWANTITEHSGEWQDAFVYFKHEEAGKGPEFARQLKTSLGIG